MTVSKKRETEESDEVKCSRCDVRGSAKSMWDAERGEYLCDDCAEQVESESKGG